MASEAAALLDQLMGRSRNAGSGDEVSKEHWSDPDVCKYFLCGFCPSELFTNTRSDIGPCDKIHDEPLQIAYAGSSDYGRIGYEEQFLECLEKVVRDLDKRIQRGKERLSRSAEANKKAFIEESGTMYSEKLHNLSEQITELIDRSEELGGQGNVEEAQELILKVEELERDKERERSAMMFKANVPQTVAGFEIDPGNFHEKNEICDVCGCFLIIGDTQARMDAHLMGKQHMGFARIRSKIVELKQAKEDRMTKEREERKSRESRSNRSPPVPCEKSPDRIGRRPSYQSGEREKRRSRSRDRNRRRGGGRSRSRDRRRSRSRDRRRSRSRDRRRSRSRDRRRRSRSGDRRRSHRSRSRDTRRQRRSRSRSHDRNKRRDRRERSKERSRHDSHHSRSESTDKREKRVSNDEGGGGDHCEQNGEKEENGTQETIET